MESKKFCDFCNVELTESNKGLRYLTCEKCEKKILQLDRDRFAFQFVDDKIRILHNDFDEHEDSITIDRNILVRKWEEKIWR